MSLDGADNTNSEKPDKSDIHIDLGFEFLRRLNEVSSKYYGGNRTQALRRGIQELETWHEDEAEQQWSKDELHRGIEENQELLQSLQNQLESIREEINKSNKEFSHQPESAESVSEEIKHELYRELADADRWLTVDHLIARTNLELVDLSVALGELIDESTVESQEDEKVRYGIAGTTHRTKE